MAKELICVKVEPLMKTKIKIVAQREGRSVPDVVRAAFLEYVEKHEDKHSKISADEINQIQLFSNRGE